jgi:CheY-like chemotaxis protein
MNAANGGLHRPRQILIVDDESAVLKTYQNALQEHFPYDRVEVASNGFDAVEAFRLHKHDLIVMDIHMPVMDGRAAEYEIRMFCEEQSMAEPNIVFFTGYLPPEDIEEMVRRNPSCSLLLKPVALSTLIKEIEKRFAEASAAA